jgi:UDP-N-acetylmuramate--alanine ligase
MKKRIYMVGIKGVAMTSLAVYFAQQGHEVVGSDVAEIFTTDTILAKYHIPIKTAFSVEHITSDFDLVVVTGAHGGMTNVEAIRAKELGIDVVMHGQMLGRSMEGRTGISVAGCHGKTTTTALTAHILARTGLDPSYAIGVATINSIGEGGHFGTGEYFIAEADEYVTDPQSDKTPRFLWQHPQIIILTNIEFDHPDVYKNLEDVTVAYKAFIEQLPKDGLLIACIDDPSIKTLLSQRKYSSITYGFSEKAEYRITDISYTPGCTNITVSHTDSSDLTLELSIPGKHNALNAVAAAITASKTGISWNDIQRHIVSFTGTKRRFEKIADINDYILYDDYAHHPSEIAATLSAAREWYPHSRIIAIFQPHTFSRTKTLLTEFSKAFDAADIVLMVDIYPSARESYDKSITSKMIVDRIHSPQLSAKYLASQADVLEELDVSIRKGDIIITMGAGDISSWHPSIVEILETKMVK